MFLRDYFEYLGDNVVGTANFAKFDDTEIAGAVCDSRNVKPGYLFCAMKGARLDGHEYIKSALEKGAVALLAEKNTLDIPVDCPVIFVRNPYRSFGLVAELNSGKPAGRIKLLGVTGTNGKTTTAFFLRAILAACNKSTGMVGTVEYDFGKGECLQADRTTPTPFQLQDIFSKMLANDVEYAPIEVSSHALEQGRLGTVKCSVAIFTNLTQDHLDYHINMDNYYEAKKLLFTEYLAAEAPSIINADDKYGCRLAGELKGKKVLSFSFDGNPEATVPARNLVLKSTGSSFDLELDGDTWHVSVCLPGRYNAENAACAVCTAYALGLPKDIVLKTISASHGAPGRMQPVACSDFSVYVDYAHTDDALRNALKCLKGLPHNRLTVVFGCGGDRDRTKRPLMGKAAADLADRLYVTSDNPRTENPDDIISEILNGIPYDTAYQVIADRREAISRAVAEAEPDDIILIAGKGHEDYQEVNGVKHHFNDVEVATEAINARN